MVSVCNPPGLHRASNSLRVLLRVGYPPCFAGPSYSRPLSRPPSDLSPETFAALGPERQIGQGGRRPCSLASLATRILSVARGDLVHGGVRLPPCPGFGREAAKRDRGRNRDKGGRGGYQTVRTPRYLRSKKLVPYPGAYSVNVNTPPRRQATQHSTPAPTASKCFDGTSWDDQAEVQLSIRSQ